MSVINDNLTVRGMLVCEQFAPPNNSIGSDAIDASDPILVDKQQHQYIETYRQAGAAVTAVVVLHHAYGDGTVLGVDAGSVAACIGAATVIVNVKKNGTTILSSTFTLDNANTAYISEAGSISVSSYSAGEVLTADITAAAGGGTLATGLWVRLVVKEDAAP